MTAVLPPEYRTKPPDELAIVNLTGKCSELFLKISRDQHGKSRPGNVEKLKSDFETWRSQESLESSSSETPNAASLQILLQLDSMGDFYHMTAQELLLLHTQLSRLEYRKERRLKRQVRQFQQGLAPPSSKRRRNGRGAKSDPGGIKSNETTAHTEIGTDGSEYASTLSVISGLSFEKECGNVDRTFKRLQQVSVLSRCVAVETKHPEINKYLSGGKNDEHLRQMFPRASAWIADTFHGVPQDLQERAAVLMSTKVWELVLAKGTLKVDLNAPFPSTRLISRSRTLDLGPSELSSRSLSGSIRRAYTAPAGAYYPAFASLHGVGVTNEQVLSLGTQPAAKSARFHPISGEGAGEFLICTAASCAAPPTMFKDAREWATHHHEHHPLARAWRCTAIAHKNDLPEHSSVSEFYAHMRDDHPGSFDESDLPELADACRKPWHCPLCSSSFQSYVPGEEGWDRRKLDHLRHHLERISAVCLKWVPDYENGIAQPDTAMEMWKESEGHETGNLIENPWIAEHCSSLK